MPAVRVRITGRVQGVGYRYWAVGKAHDLRLSGWVRNRRDGSVEAVLSGGDDAVEKMLQACRDGPPLARVTDVSVSPFDKSVKPGFEALPTA